MRGGAEGMRRAAGALVACCVLAPLAGAEPAPPEGADMGLGPLRVASQSPGQSLRLGLVPRTPSNLPAGSWEVFAGSTWVNVWASKDDYQLDYEALATDVAVTCGLDGYWQAEAGFTTRTTFGGCLDGFIQGFHRSVGMGQGGRDQVAAGRTVMRIEPSSSQPGVDLGPADLDGDTVVHGRATLQRTLFHGGERHPGLAVALTALAPLGGRRQAQGGDLDLGLDLIASQRFGSWYGYATATFTRYGADRVYGVRLHRSNWSGFAAMEWRVSPSWSLIAQYLVSEGVAPDYHVFSRASHEVTGGTKVAITGGVCAEFGLIENVFIFDNSPDFGLHLALRARF